MKFHFHCVQKGPHYSRHFTPSEFLIDIERIASIQLLNSFASEPFLKNSAKRSSGLWSVPSYFNHSCVPNTVRFFFGDIMLIYARRDIFKGEQVTVNYLSNQLEYGERQEICEKIYGFRCFCELCECEEKEVPRLAGLRQELFMKLVIK